MTAASPGVVSMFLGDTHYKNEEAFLWAVAGSDEARVRRRSCARASCCSSTAPISPMTRHREFAIGRWRNSGTMRACTSRC